MARREQPSHNRTRAASQRRPNIRQTKKYPPTARAVRYWLQNGTYVDLQVPYEQIATPFENDPAHRAVVLTDYEKAKLVAELSKCEAAIRAGSLDMLELAVEICNRCSLPLPGWLLPHIIEAINRLLRLNSRTRQERRQREIH